MKEILINLSNCTADEFRTLIDKLKDEIINCDPKYNHLEMSGGRSVDLIVRNDNPMIRFTFPMKDSESYEVSVWFAALDNIGDAAAIPEVEWGLADDSLSLDMKVVLNKELVEHVVADYEQNCNKSEETAE